MTTRPGARGAQSLRSSGDRWLFGYADVVTLLFACFATLYAAQAKPVASPSPASPRPIAAVASALADLIRSQDQVLIDLTTREGGLVISVAEAGSFASARADLTPAARGVMEQLAAILRGREVYIRVEGHTDDRPIRASSFQSNWELSTARATSVLQFLIEQGEVPAARLSAAGYGEYRPRVPNQSDAARARNRRVDLVVWDAVQAAPAAADYQGAVPRPDGER